MDSQMPRSQLQSKINHQQVARDFHKPGLGRVEKQTGSRPHSSKEGEDSERDVWTAEFHIKSSKDKLSQSKSESGSRQMFR